MTNPVRIGIVGAGRLGTFHAQKAMANPDAELAAIYDPLEENRDRLAERFAVPSVETLEDFLPRVDAVVIAAPSTRHAELGAYFLNAGKHLLMEKPLCSRAADAEALAALAEEKRLTLQVGHVEQFNPAWTTAGPFLRRMREEGPMVIEATRQSGYTFRCVDVGATLDIMIHDLELILSVLDAPIESISARTVTEFGGFEDSVWAQLEFGDGSLARLFASRVEPTPRREITFRSAERRVRIDFAARTAETIEPSEEILRGDYAPEKIVYSEIAPAIPAFMNDRYRTRLLDHEPFDALALEMENFVGAIQFGEEPRVPGHRAAAAVRLAEKILKEC